MLPLTNPLSSRWPHMSDELIVTLSFGYPDIPVNGNSYLKHNQISTLIMWTIANHSCISLVYHEQVSINTGSYIIVIIRKHHTIAHVTGNKVL